MSPLAQAFGGGAADEPMLAAGAATVAQVASDGEPFVEWVCMRCGAGFLAPAAPRPESPCCQSIDTKRAMRWPVAAWRWLRAAALRIELYELEHYIRDCERCGIADSLNLRRFRAEAQALRVRLIDLQGA